MRYAITALIALGLAGGVTAPKLYKMCQIRGWVPGGDARMESVTQKWHQRPEEHHEGRNVYWIAWTEDSIRKRGGHRINLEREPWDAVQIGQPIEVIKFPGDSHPYLRSGIFVSTSNFLVDSVLLVIEIVVAVRAVRRLVAGRAAAVNAE